MAQVDVESFEGIDIFEMDESEPDWQVIYFGEGRDQVKLYVDPMRVCIWENSNVMSEWCIKNQGLFKQKRVMELGCGMALPAMTVAALNATEVIATDISPTACKIVKECMAYSRSVGQQSSPFSASVLDWNEVFTAELASGIGAYKSNLPRVDVILGSDVLYASEHGLPLAAAVDTHLIPGGLLVLTTRNFRPGLDLFLENIQKIRGFQLVNEEQYNRGEEEGTKSYKLYVMQKPEPIES
ncbi:hypothetical protein CYMTET_17286 [Cymbomonas tetramitiformis]|uniref:Calmodulin-lysine N-methyltransferase n=1 Tax=Cymbomonas tetramitiformis TaxID=36881 RepID=A0AAE0L743_9CHLO|nr:hypothetical protein CYMTET_17286 [Cymbomonas tetramitiformis]